MILQPSLSKSKKQRRRRRRRNICDQNRKSMIRYYWLILFIMILYRHRKILGLTTTTTTSRQFSNRYIHCRYNELSFFRGCIAASRQFQNRCSVSLFAKNDIGMNPSSSLFTNNETTICSNDRHFSSSDDNPNNPKNDHAYYSLSLSIPTIDIMEEMGALLSVVSKPTDVILLDGDLGAGKTTFARGFIECKLGLLEENDDVAKDDDDTVTDDSTSQKKEADAGRIRVTSPTYLLSNTYTYNDENEATTREIHHMDLYRLSGTSTKDFEALALPYVFANCISLIEWPSRLNKFPELLPPLHNQLQIDIRIIPLSDERKMTLTTIQNSTWTNRLEELVNEGMVDDLMLQRDDNA